MTITTLAYLRVSDPRQATPDKVSLEDQRRALEQLAGTMGRELGSDGIFADPGVSGGTANRPGFQRLIAHCHAHPLKRDARGSCRGRILVFRDDRWGRFDDADEAGYWSFTVRQLGYDVCFAVMGSEDPQIDNVLRFVGRMGATAERQKIKARAKSGMRGAAEKGYWCQKAPFGYRRLAVDKITGAERVLEAGQRKSDNEFLRLTLGPAEECELVRMIFARYASGEESITSVHARLDVAHPERFSWSFVRRLLVNPTYCGDLVTGRATGDGVVRRDIYPALVDRDQWERVQLLMARNQVETSPVRYGYPLSGLIRCGSCGSPFVGGGHAKGRGADSEAPMYFYRDSGSIKRPRCPGKMATLLARDVEPRIIAAIAEQMQRTHVSARLAKAFDAILDRGQRAGSTRRGELQSRMQQLEVKRDRLLAAIASGTVLEAEAGKQLRQLRREIDATSTDLDRTRFTAGRLARLTAERDRLVAVASDFAGVASRMQGAALRELLRPWIASAVAEKSPRRIVLQLRVIPEMPGLQLAPNGGPIASSLTPDLPPIILPLDSRSEACRAREARKRTRRAEERRSA